jgi:hypothetical protein
LKKWRKKMKKTTIVLVLLFFGYGLFANDARVLPLGIGRVSINPSYSFVTGEYDDLRNFIRHDEVSTRLFNLGFALDYGLFNWITASVQWAPGWTSWSDESAAPNDISELFAGAKIQLLGVQAPFRSDEFRFLITPGVFIPLLDNHIFAVGARFHFDWAFNRNFFVTLSNETLFYPGNQDFSNTGPGFYDINEDVNYSLRFGIGSVFTTPITNGINFTVGLPASYRFLPASQHSITVNPHMSLFFNTPLPLEFKFQYYAPLWGMNSIARHNASLEVRLYFPLLPGR